jgi:outer membrane protein TolC
MTTMYAIAVALALGQAGAQPAPQASQQQALSRERPAPTLTLEDALREGRARNFDLKVAQARLEQSKQLHARAWSAYLPQVTASGSLTHNDFSDVVVQLPTGFAVRDCGAPGCTLGPTPLPPGLPGTATTLDIVPTGLQNAVVAKQNQLAAQIQATQAIIALPAVYGIAAARASERLASDNAEQARQDILFSVAQAYYNAAGLKQVVEVNERQLAIAREHERDAKVRYDAGTAPKVTLLRAEIDRARAEQDLKRAQNSYLSAKVAVATLIDRPNPEFDVTVPPAVQIPDNGSLEDRALRDRYDVRASQEQVTVAEKTREGTVSTYVPVLGAFGRYQYSNAAGFTGSTTTWAIGLQATWNIFDGGLREATLRDNQARVAEAEAARESLVARAKSEVVTARLDLDSAVANREKAKEQQALAEENQRLVNVNYKAGAATYIEVSDANTALLTAELSQVSEGLNADLAALRLVKAAGGFDPK